MAASCNISLFVISVYNKVKNLKKFKVKLKMKCYISRHSSISIVSWWDIHMAACLSVDVSTTKPVCLLN